MTVSHPKSFNQSQKFLRCQPLQFRIEATAGVPPSQAGTDTASPGREPTRSDAAPQQTRDRRQRAEAEQEPLIRRAREGLGAQIVRMDDGFAAAPPPPRQATAETADEEP